MDAVELLVSQHRELERHLDDALNAKTADNKHILFQTISDELALHIAAEEQVFYPAVQARWTEYDLLLSLEEHLSLKRLLSDLVALESAVDQQFHIKLKVLTEQAKHHHKQEEDYLFPKVTELVAPCAREELGREMQELQKRLKCDGVAKSEICRETDTAVKLA